MMRPTVDLSRAAAFVRALTGSDQTPVTWQTFDDSDAKRPHLARVFSCSLEQAKRDLLRLNADGAGIFVAVNTTDLLGRREENVRGIRALFIDSDGGKVRPFALAPSFVVHSARGPHAYWLTRPGEALASFTPAQTQLARFYATDLAVKDLPRVMRVPGFFHMKKAPVLVRFEPGTGVAHSIADILVAHPLPVVPSKPLPAAPLRLQSPASEGRDQRGTYTAGALRNAAANVRNAPEGARNNTLNAEAHGLARKAADLRLNEGDIVSALAPAAQAAGLSSAETERTIRSGLEAGRANPVRVELKQGAHVRGALALAAVPDAEAGEPIEDWPARQPLPPVADNVPTLPADLIPEPLRPWLVDIADRVSIPLEFVTAPALVGLGSVVGRSIALRPMARDDFAVSGNLWGGIVGPPGVMKTGAIEQAIKPLRRLAAIAREAYEAAEADREADLETIDAKRKAARSSLEKATKGNDADNIAKRREELKTLHQEEAGASTKERRFITSDATIEKLGELLNENSRGLLIVRDELTGWLRGLDREDRAQDRAFHLEAWNGSGSFTVDRIGRGTLHVEALCLSIVGGIQPGKLSTYIRGAIKGEDDADGLVQRLQLLVWPDAFGEWRAVDRWPDRDSRERAFRIFERLSKLEAGDFGAETEEDELPYLRFDTGAQELFLAWRTELERRVRSEEMAETPAFCAHLSKFRSLFPKLALLFHLVDVADSARPGPVSLVSAQRAGAWMDFLERHARKVYAAELAPNVSAAHVLAERIKDGHVTDRMSVREVAERDWSGLTRSGDVYGAAETLEPLGWLRVETLEAGARGGRPSAVLRIHPDFRRAK
jgi:Protein of unknown function (DUF3987)